MYNSDTFSSSPMMNNPMMYSQPYNASSASFMGGAVPYGKDERMNQPLYASLQGKRERKRQQKMPRNADGCSSSNNTVTFGGSEMKQQQVNVLPPPMTIETV